MAYSVSKLITQSYYTSGMVARGLRQPSGTELTDGLFLLNGLLADKTPQFGLIPFYKQEEFPTVARQEMYFVENLVSVETDTFNIAEVRFPVVRISRKEYFGSGRADNVYSLPSTFHDERTLNGTNIYFYPVPDAVYTIKIWGKFALDQIDDDDFDQDLLLTYEMGYLNYMRYKLAQEICFHNAFSFSDASRKHLDVLEKNLDWQSPRDLSVTKVSTLSTNDCDPEWYNTLKITGGFLPGGY